jgi:hypothetical protein
MGFGAGTDANIYCTLGGENGLSGGEVHLADSLLHVNKFERGQVGVFDSKCVLRFVPFPEPISLRKHTSSHAVRWMRLNSAGNIWAECRKLPFERTEVV